MSISAAATRISLNDRFKIIRQRVNNNAGPSGMNRTGNQQMNRNQGSMRNQRLAMKMANRPSVLAALRIKNKSIKQRLGNQTFNRGGFNNALRRNGTKFGNRMRNNQNAGVRNQPQNQLVKSGRLRLNRNNFQGTTRVGIRKQRQNINFSGGQRPNFVGKKKMFGNKRILPKHVRIQRMKQFGMRGGNKRMMNNRNRKMGNPGPKGQRWQRKKSFNKNQLDADIDAYMAKTKSHLDADLDAYMAEASTS